MKNFRNIVENFILDDNVAKSLPPRLRVTSDREQFSVCLLTVTSTVNLNPPNRILGRPRYISQDLGKQLKNILFLIMTIFSLLILLHVNTFVGF